MYPFCNNDARYAKFEDFNHGGLPACFTFDHAGLNNVSGAGKTGWQVGKTTSYPELFAIPEHDGNCLFFDDVPHGISLTTTHKLWMKLPVMDFTNFTNITLSFDSYNDRRNGGTTSVKISTDGSTWVTLYSLGEDKTVPIWASIILSLEDYEDKEEVHIAFCYDDSTSTSYSNQTNGWAIDNLKLDAEVSYKITYDLGVGIQNPLNAASYTNKEVLRLFPPKSFDYRFLGWYESSDFSGYEVIDTFPLGTAGDKYFFAKWEFARYPIIYELGGGKNNPGNPDTYSFYDPNIYLWRPTKTGYTFVSWIPNNLIATGSYGEKKFTAMWRAGDSDDPSLLFLSALGSDGENLKLQPAFHPDSTHYNIILPCDENHCEVRIMSDPDGLASIVGETIYNFSGPDLKTISVHTTSASRKTTRTYVITVIRPFEQTIVHQYYDDILAVNKNESTNVGYTFTKYQWVRNDEWMVGEAGSYLYLNGAPSKTDEFNVWITVADSSMTIPLCAPLSITYSRVPIGGQLVEEEFRVYPNPVHSQITVENRDWENAQVIEIFDMNGRMMMQSQSAGLRSVMDVSNLLQGGYIVRVGTQTAKIIINK
ncbi:hypothetical protein FACS1894195_2930 [Bacteroidia bacterium]|nr:hypothetical protein FACS1894195_2930 [Bacteroidia bacterium]